MEEPKFEQTLKYNRLIIIGNGFDIAAGLPSSLNDFLLWYLKKNVKFASTNLISEDAVFKFDARKVNVGVLNSQIEGITSPKDLLDKVKKCHLKCSIKCDFSQKLLTSIESSNWIDIEQIYYDSVIQISEIVGQPQALKDEALKLNRAIECLNKELKEYLVFCESELADDFYEESPLNKMLDKFKKNQDIEIAKLRKMNKYQVDLQNVFYVNFNYTNTVLNLPSFKNFGLNKHIAIHGNISEEKNPLIFGYGDDTNPNYEKLEYIQEEQLLKHIKSFHYHYTPNYLKVLNSLDNLPFEVFIVGHSCGLTDKTLLNTIFEHENCRSIRAFYWKDEEEALFKRISISRHFSNKKKMREILDVFDEEDIIPQNNI